MQIEKVEREILPGGKVKLCASDLVFIFERPGVGKLLVTVLGHDRGQFGTSTLDEIVYAIQREGTVELFIDAREAKGIAVAVSDAWTRFFTANQDKLKRVHVLVTSEYVHLTIAIARHLSGTGGLIRIHSKEDHFLTALKNDTLV